MAIFSHKWLMLWRKKHIVINLSWHGGYGSLLSSFEVLEVPKTDNSSIVWRHHSKSPVPLEGVPFNRQTQTPTMKRKLSDLYSTCDHTVHWFWRAEFNTGRLSKEIDFIENSVWCVWSIECWAKKIHHLDEQEVKNWSWTNESYLTVLGSVHVSQY